MISGVMGKEEDCDQAMEEAWNWIEAASDAEFQLANKSAGDDGFLSPVVQTEFIRN